MTKDVNVSVSVSEWVGGSVNVNDCEFVCKRGCEFGTECEFEYEYDCECTFDSERESECERERQCE